MEIKKDRKLNRWPGYDYSRPGLYYITICTKDRYAYFGKVQNNLVYLNNLGQVALKYWIKIPEIYNNVELDEYIIMPNHIHGILIINENKFVVGTEHCSVPTKTKHNKMGFLSQIIKFYKEAVIKDIKKQYNFAWQRSFYDRVIRNEKELSNIRKYIVNNPINWQFGHKNLNKKYVQ
jgi:REP element-mobilizing transposase RayT